MSSLHVTWIQSSGGNAVSPGAMINDIISGEIVTTSGTAATSGVKPNGATHAIVTAIDANHYVTPRGLSVVAALGTGVPVILGSFHCMAVPDSGKISAVTY
mgnify:CR=1 FL=1